MKLGEKRKRKKSLRGIGRKHKYFWLIFTSILQPWLRAALKDSSFALAYSHTMYSRKQIIQQTIDTANTSWGGKSCALPACGCRCGRQTAEVRAEQQAVVSHR